MSLQAELKRKYSELFTKFKIDKKTGELKEHPELKFPTYPYIGSNYMRSPKKILIVGLDVGADRLPGRIQCFQTRRENIGYKELHKHNPHIAGTYFTALYFLKKELDWRELWNKTKDIGTCQKILKGGKNLPDTNPLSYISLTNYRKFVRVGKKDKSAKKSKNDMRCFEEDFTDFLVEETDIFQPDMVVFQSVEFKKKKRLLETITSKIYIGPHPSWRGKRQPGYFCKQIKRFPFDK